MAIWMGYVLQTTFLRGFTVGAQTRFWELLDTVKGRGSHLQFSCE